MTSSIADTFRQVFQRRDSEVLMWMSAFQQCKDFENRLRFDKVTESLKVGTFLRHSVHYIKGYGKENSSQAVAFLVCTNFVDKIP